VTVENLKLEMKNSKLRYLFPVVILLLAVSFAQAAEERQMDITAGIENKEVYVGDRIKLNVIAEGVSGYELDFPEAPEKPGEFSFVESYPLRKRGRSAGRVYVMSIYTTGTHVIPPVEVKYRRKGESDWRITQSPQVPVEILSLLTDEDDDIVGVKGLVAIGSILPGVIFTFLAVFVIAVLVFYFFRRRKTAWERLEAMRVKSAHEIAYEQLKRLKKEDLPHKGRINEYYVRLSDIVRRYLENRFSYRVPEMTTEEFMETIKEAPELTEEHKKLLKNFLSHCDMVKFAKYGPTPLEMLDSFRAAEDLVDQTKYVEEAKDMESEG